MKSRLWIEVPIDERLPKEKGYYTVIAPGWEGGFINTFYESGYGFKDKDFEDGDITKYVTHWLEPYDIDTESPEYISIVLTHILRHASQEQIKAITQSLIERGGLDIPTYNVIRKMAYDYTEDCIYDDIGDGGYYQGLGDGSFEGYTKGFTSCLEVLNIRQNK